jgi:hypothetical protein
VFGAPMNSPKLRLVVGLIPAFGHQLFWRRFHPSRAMLTLPVDLLENLRVRRAPHAAACVLLRYGSRFAEACC